ncbi:hypothetical protein AVEN_228742-1 [Araneus ventricosus]|uniref:Uncharacterized protein n=1 Tax=Araneus ventricosus TaxID=182803 RepID=A0A4Y2Q431_ARAVE|nr:hypothetical protein AVEN_228742-1 [Araneus ventricosus]
MCSIVSSCSPHGQREKGNQWARFSRPLYYTQIRAFQSKPDEKWSEFLDLHLDCRVINQPQLGRGDFGSVRMRRGSECDAWSGRE